MKRLLCILAFAACLAQAKDGAFRADKSGHLLLDRKGNPFLWLGDTAWLLFQMTTREDADLYLRTRAKQGFTVVQAALSMAEKRVTGGKGVAFPNRYGAAAFTDKDTVAPLVTPGNRPGHGSEYDYWDHAEYIVDTANRHGLVLALLPIFIASSGDGYSCLTQATAEPYGKFLGQRFGKKPNVIWVLGGDNVPETAEKRDVWDRLARGIATGIAGRVDYESVAMTYHISSGSSSSAWFHTTPWLDFNMLQTWSLWDRIFSMVKADYERMPPRPVVMSEGAYENGPQYPTRPINALIIRRQAYLSYFAGGGHTYGNTDVWNFSSFRDEATEDWKQALQSPGAASLTILRRFLDSLPWFDFVPDETVFPPGAAGEGGGRRAAMRSRDGSRVLVYLPDRRPITIRLPEHAGAGATEVSWFNPTTGKYVKAARIPAGDDRNFTPPEGFEDAVLILKRL
jgi:hypothetical protein